jgi:homogentisate 1,2-dioxygenase
VSRWIQLPRVEGRASRQAHADLPPGTYEREIGKEGFFGPATHMYHAHPPTGWTRFEGPLRPRAFDLRRLAAEGPCPLEAPALFENAHLRYRVWRCAAPMPELARNADGDELVFVHAGSGDLFCDYGHLAFGEGDYLLLPRGTQWRVEPAAPVLALLVEASGSSYRLPERGLLGEHALFDPAVLAAPALDEAFRAQQGELEWRVRVRARGRISTLTYPFNPLDAVGWKGTLCPVRLNWRDIRPVGSARYHLPPPVHTTFVADRFVVCTFCPRPLESDPGALKLPFFHSNDDYDELLFYHRGRFTSRDGIEPGMLTFHPSGFPHGPHPAALAASQRAPRRETDEVAVMLDARDPLEPAPFAAQAEWEGYVDSWRAPA